MPSAQRHQPAERPLGDRDREVALDGRLDHRGELREQVLFLFVRDRDRPLDPPGQRRAVPQQEEDQVQHDAEADDEAHRVLADVDRLRREVLTELRRALAQPILYARQIQQAELLQLVMQPLGQHRDDLLQVVGEIEIAGSDPAVDRRPLARQQHADQRHRKDHDEEDQQQRRARGEVAPFRHPLQQPPVERREQQRQDRRPEHRFIERVKDRQEADRDQDQQQQERRTLQAGRIHRTRRGSVGNRQFA